MIARGVKAGDRVALIFDKSVETYVALLAVMKVNAAYLPLDAGFPNDRLEFILEDAGAKRLLSMSMFAEKLAALPVETIFLDDRRGADRRDADSPADRGRGRRRPRISSPTSSTPPGTTGKPKGVAIDHAEHLQLRARRRRNIRLRPAATASIRA